MGFGGNRRVLLVGGEGVVLYAPQGKGVVRETSISWEVPNFDQQLTEAFGAKNQSKSVVVLFDGTDQTYRKEENIPKLSPIDRPRFVKRKLELAFPSYPIRASLEVKPPKKKGAAGKSAPKVPPSFLFVALPETDQLDRIGNAMYESGVPVTGFGLLPLESTGLVDELSDKIFGGKGVKKSRWAVLVGQHETGGLRQIVIKDGNLALTRLTPTSEAGASGQGWVEEVTREFKATLTYISRFGYSNDDGLDIIVVCGEAEKQFFDQKAIPVTNFRCVNVSEALRFIGARTFGLEKTNFSDALHAAWVGRKSSMKLPIKVPSIHRIMVPRLAARIGSGLMALSIVGLLAFTAQDFQSYRSLDQDVEQKQIQKSSLSREYDQESKVFDSLPIKPAIVKAALQVKKVLEKNTMDLRPLLHTLKNALPSDARMESLVVEHEASPSLKVEGAATGGNLFGGATNPDDRGKVIINFSFTLPDGLTQEQKEARADEIVKGLQTAFTGFDVTLKQSFGGAAGGGDSKSQGMQGVFGVSTDNNSTPQTAQAAVTAAAIEIRGAPLQ